MSLTSSIYNLTRNRLLQHGLFWALSFYVLTRLFAYSDKLTLVDWIYTFLFHFSLWLAVYINLMVLIPSFLEKRKYLHFLVFLIATILAGIGLNLLTFNYLSDWIFPGYYFIAYYDFWNIFEFVVAYIVISTLIKLSKSWFNLRDTQQQLIRLEREKLEAELKALKSQVNPHFLFNSLNNLYALALDSDPRTPGIILQLSEMMRYLLYETNTSLVPLSTEIVHLENYIELQRLRIGDKTNIEMTVNGDTGDVMIAPLIFLTFVENGFKHGVKAETENTFIRISLAVSGSSLIFKVINNKGTTDEKLAENSKGVGLQNLKRRLEIQYPEKHSIELMETNETFSVVLNLTISRLTQSS